jgi:hypothetical protein
MFACNYRNPMESSTSCHLATELRIVIENGIHARMRKDIRTRSRYAYDRPVNRNRFICTKEFTSRLMETSPHRIYYTHVFTSSLPGTLRPVNRKTHDAAHPPSSRVFLRPHECQNTRRRAHARVHVTRRTGQSNQSSIRTKDPFKGLISDTIGMP